MGIMFAILISTNISSVNPIIEQQEFCDICSKVGRQSACKYLVQMNNRMNDLEYIMIYRESLMIKFFNQWLVKNRSIADSWYNNKVKYFSDNDMAIIIVNDIKNGNLSYSEVNTAVKEVGEIVYNYKYYRTSFDKLLNNLSNNTTEEYGMCGICHKKRG